MTFGVAWKQGRRDMKEYMMGVNLETARKAEIIARRISNERQGTEALWEMYLQEAYDELFQRPTRR